MAAEAAGQIQHFLAGPQLQDGADELRLLVVHLRREAVKGKAVVLTFEYFIEPGHRSAPPGSGRIPPFKTICY